MEYLVIAICTAVAVTVAVMIIFKGRKKKENNAELVESKKSSPVQGQQASQELSIQMEMLPAESVPEDHLVEIKDSKILARVNNVIPGFAQAGNAANNAVQAAKANGQVLYRAILPANAKLVNSRELEGAYRGFYRNAKNIQGQANWVPVEAQTGAAAVANTAAAAMSVAAMVVGQYYMTQINSQLGDISDGISKIADFQDNEYRSRVFSLISHVKTIADFQEEILENDELRMAKIAQLDSLEEECTKLLGQANLTLAGYAKKADLDYSGYEQEVAEAQNWYMYQKALLDVLYKISDLRYALHLGAVSREQCNALLPTYTKQVQDAQTKLSDWHNSTVKRLNIDTDESRRKRSGFDGVVHFIPGLIDDDQNYKAISQDFASMIIIQTESGGSAHLQDNSELYAEDVQLISKDGKVYYLPPERPEPIGDESETDSETSDKENTDEKGSGEDAD